MQLSSRYLRNREELKFGGALVGMILTGILLSNMLTRGIENSPIKAALWRLFDPFGINPVAPGAVLLGVYLTGLLFLTIDRTKRPQSIFLIIVTVIGLFTMGINGQFFPALSLDDLALFFLGCGLAILYIGPEDVKRITISDPNDGSSSTLQSKGSRRLEFRSAERLLYGLLTALLLVAFFEAHTQYAPPVTPNLLPNLEAVTSFRLTGTQSDLLTIDFATTGLFLLMLFFFLGYDAQRTYFIVGPKRSGKTHAAIALHEEAEERGYNPRNETNDLLRLENKLVEGDGWAEETSDETQDLSFSFTSKGLFKKNIQLEAIDYPGELVRAILPAVQYHTAPEDELLNEYDNAQTREQWLEIKIKESREADSGYEHGQQTSRLADGGTTSRSTRSSETDDAPESLTDEAFAKNEDDSSDGTNTGSEDDTESSIAGAPTDSRDLKLIRDEILPAFQRADTLLLVVDLKKHLSGESLAADVLYNIYDKSDKEAIILATKGDLLADEFVQDRGWKSPWTREAYDEFRTYVQSELSDHNVLRKLLNRIERPYPVGYQTVRPDGVEDEDEDDLEREIDRRTGLGKKRIQVNGYEYVLERLN